MSAPVVLVIGGSDSSGGAGVTRDVTVLAEFGIEAAVAITAVTAQTDQQVNRIQHVPPDVISEQIRCALTARNIAAIKIGMLGCRASLDAVITSLPAACPLVLDPVLTASSGRVLLDADAMTGLRMQLIPRATVLTPNMPEAAVLLQCAAAQGDSALLEQARALLALGPGAVLLKGGHAAGSESLDLLVTRSGTVERLRATRIAVTLRGTGCMLSSAVAAGLARGESLLEASRRAKNYVHEQLQRALERRNRE